MSSVFLPMSPFLFMPQDSFWAGFLPTTLPWTLKAKRAPCIPPIHQQCSVQAWHWSHYCNYSPCLGVPLHRDPPQEISYSLLQPWHWEQGLTWESIEGTMDLGIDTTVGPKKRYYLTSERIKLFCFKAEEGKDGTIINELASAYSHCFLGCKYFKNFWNDLGIRWIFCLIPPSF